MEPLIGARTTATSAEEGRLKVDAGRKAMKKKKLRETINSFTKFKS